MPNSKPFSDLVDRAYRENPGMQQEVATIKQAIQDAHELAELRRRRGVTQVELATRLGITQGNVSQLEGRSELYFSTLKEYVEALGGRLVVTAVFPDEPEPVPVTVRQNARSQR